MHRILNQRIELEQNNQISLSRRWAKLQSAIIYYLAHESILFYIDVKNENNEKLKT